MLRIVLLSEHNSVNVGIINLPSEGMWYATECVISLCSEGQDII